MLSRSYTIRFGVCSVVCEGWDVSSLEAVSPLHYTAHAACVSVSSAGCGTRNLPFPRKAGFSTGPRTAPGAALWTAALFDSFRRPEVLTHALRVCLRVCADGFDDACLLAGQSHRCHRLRDWLPSKNLGHVCSGSSLLGSTPNVSSHLAGKSMCVPCSPGEGSARCPGRAR